MRFFPTFSLCCVFFANLAVAAAPAATAPPALLAAPAAAAPVAEPPAWLGDVLAQQIGRAHV